MRIGQRFRRLLKDIEAEVALQAMPLRPVILTLDPKQIEALAMAAKALVRQGDPALASAAQSALAALVDAVPSQAHRRLGLRPPFQTPHEARDQAMVAIGQSLRQRHKLRLAYEDVNGAFTARTIWPVAVAIFEHARLLAAWCEMRNDWRHFRLDRMVHAHVVAEAIPKSRLLLLGAWRDAHAHRWEQALVT